MSAFAGHGNQNGMRPNSHAFRRIHDPLTMMKRPTGSFWLDTFLARKTTDRVPDRDLTGRTIVFTGGTDGIGRAAVDRFAAMGAEICLFGRDPQKTQRVADDLAAVGHKGPVSIVACDIGSLDQVRSAADQVLVRHERIDWLINCAGINTPERRLSADGYEMNFAVNYLGPFLLTELLLERVRATPSARIVNLTSGTQEVARLNLDDLQLETGWSLLQSYARAKLCMIMHGRDVAWRGASINCLNPGYIRTKLSRGGSKSLFSKLFGGLAAPAWVGGERILAAALDSAYEGVSGQYIHEDRLLDPNPQALDDDKVARLMAISRRMTGLA